MLRVMPVAVLLALLLASCAGGATPEPDAAETADPTPTVTATAPSDEPTDGSETSEPEPEPEPGLTADDRANVRDAITSGNVVAIEGYLSDPVHFIIMASECCWDITPEQAVAELTYVSSAPGPWDFNLPAATVDVWRTNTYYGGQFTGDDIVGRAADGTIISFGIEGDQITKILMGFEEGFSH
jgi:hypothetical protein